jgi:hypothetical protein
MIRQSRNTTSFATRCTTPIRISKSCCVAGVQVGTHAPDAIRIDMISSVGRPITERGERHVPTSWNSGANLQASTISESKEVMEPVGVETMHVGGP